MPFWKKKKSTSKMTETELLVVQKAEAEALAETQVKKTNDAFV